MALTKITPQMFDTSATAHDLNVDNGTFVVDGSASRVGIGTATPNTLLDVNGALTATTIAGTLTTAAQTNITSVGTLGSLTTSGNITSGNDIYVPDGRFFRFTPASSSSSGGFLFGDSAGTGGSIAFKRNADNFATLTLLASGNVGIGDTNPTTELVVKSSDDTQVQIVSGASNDAYLSFLNGTLQHGFKQDNTGLFTLNYYGGGSTVERIAVKTDGNVGIGETNPQFPLHVKSSSTDIAKFETSGSYTFTRFASSSRNWALSIGSDFGIYDETGTTTRFLITSANNVGIDCSPVTLKSSTTLQVSGNAKLGDNNGRGLLSLGDINSTGANVGIWRGAAGAYAGVGNYLNLGGYDGITFTTGAAEIASQTERMRIDTSGNVSIGGSTAANRTCLLYTSPSPRDS